MMASLDNFSPLPDKEEILAHYAGKTVKQLPLPCAVVDRTVVQSHCERMRIVCKKLNVGFRAHVKTHKTVEATRLQIGGDEMSIKLLVSTLPELEHLLDFLQKRKAAGASVDVLYSMPCPRSVIARLATIASRLGPGCIGVMIDDEDQLNGLWTFKSDAGFAPNVFIKVDTGYHRAGLPPLSRGLSSLFNHIMRAQERGYVRFRGFYSHASNSYASTTPDEAMGYLNMELEGLLTAATDIRTQHLSEGHLDPFANGIDLSVGATPTAATAENLAIESEDNAKSENLRQLQRTMSQIAADPIFRLELHAGVYAFLDMQQLHTQTVAGTITNYQSPGLQDVAFTVLAEVTSAYPSRQPPQALVAAGTLALGREPCPGYSGWGLVSAWGMDEEGTAGGTKEIGRSGWVVGKISQEHGLLFPEGYVGWSWSNDRLWPRREAKEDGDMPWRVGQIVKILPNHACIAGAGFPFYFVVEQGGDTVVDVWVRCRGW